MSTVSELPPLTPSQAATLRVMVQYYRQNKIPCTVRHICEARGLASPNGVMATLKILLRKGYIVRMGPEGGSRCLVPVSELNT